MKTQFTPGPWQIKKTETGCTIFHSDGHLRSNVAVCYESALCPQHGSVAGNGRLIAAVPDLLAALQGLMAIQDSVTQGQERELRAEWVPKARAALAKATQS